MSYWLCEYGYEPLTQPTRNFWDKLIGDDSKYTVFLHILIMAESKTLAEDKFMRYFETNHPGRKLKVYDVKNTVL